MTLDLEKLEALAKAATPGPWVLSKSETIVYSTDKRHGYNVYDMLGGGHEGMFDVHKKDAAFIAAAREAVPALIARVKELEAAMRAIHPYLVWTISDESPAYHPTMPSAVAAFEMVMGPTNHELRLQATQALKGNT